MRILTLLLLCSSLLLNSACDRPACTNNNPVFDQTTPDTKAYKDELIRQLAKVNASKLRYWMHSYTEDGPSKSMLVYIQGDGLCAKLALRITDSQKGIENIIFKKGMTYSGAELENLKFDIQQDSMSTVFIFREVGNIID